MPCWIPSGNHRSAQLSPWPICSLGMCCFLKGRALDQYSILMHLLLVLVKTFFRSNGRRIEMKRSLGFLAILISFVGCAAMMGEQPMTPQEAKQLTTRTYDTTYDNLFQSVITALQESSYIVTQTDKGSGLINANYEAKAGVFSKALIGDVSGRTEVSASIRKISDNQQELRLQFRSIRVHSESRYKDQPC